MMNVLEEKLLQLKDYSYQVWHYQLSHSFITFRGEQPERKNHNVEISFADVKYFQFPLGWIGDFYLASDSELLEIMMRAGMGNINQALPMSRIRENWQLYKADSPHSTIYILGHLAQIEFDVEPIYN